MENKGRRLKVEKNKSFRKKLAQEKSWLLCAHYFAADTVDKPTQIGKH